MTIIHMYCLVDFIDKETKKWDKYAVNCLYRVDSNSANGNYTFETFYEIRFIEKS